MITEAIAEAKDMKVPIYLTFLDSSKAFDMVDHTTLLTSLYDTGVRHQWWFLYQDMYTNVKSKVRLNNQLSRDIHESRTIKQGGETSTEAFKVKDNAFLTRIREHPSAYRIGATSVAVPTVADDNCLITDNHTGAQTQLLLAQQNASDNRYVFSATKSKTMLVTLSSPPCVLIISLNTPPPKPI